jgi:type IV secretion system protein VirB9
MSVRAAFAALLAATQVHAAVVPPAGAVDARVREIDFRDGQVVSLTGYVGYHIDVTLEPGERLVAVGAGDSGGVDVAAQGEHVLVKPKAAGVATNLTLVSSRRVYYFEYRAYEAQPSMTTAIFALRFRYPVATSKEAPAATDRPFSSVSMPAATVPVETERVAAAEAAVVAPVNLAYWYCGSPWLKPAAASDDGVQTRLTFSERGEWPAIFVANADGSESLVNFHAEGTTAVVHRVAQRFVLRRGRLVGCVENRGYAGSGAWVPGGALDPQVTREVAK